MYWSLQLMQGVVVLVAVGEEVASEVDGVDFVEVEEEVRQL